MGRIFISIASYCDAVLLFTLKDAYAKAKHPKNLVFGIVDQNEFTQRYEIEKLGFKDQIRYLYINKYDAHGVCWARNKAFTLADYKDDYLLQIDSHMCFDQDWDEMLLDQYNELSKVSRKPLISAYPYGFELLPNGQAKKAHQPNTTLSIVVNKISELTMEDPILTFLSIHEKTTNPVLGYALAGGFIFTSIDFVNEVPYDPWLYFNGEEQTMAIRAYTKGYDIYHPNHIPIYHLYKDSSKMYNTHHWNKANEGKRCFEFLYLAERAKERMRQLLIHNNMLGHPYGLGLVRSMDEFTEFSGIDYRGLKYEIDSRHPK